MTTRSQLRKRVAPRVTTKPEAESSSVSEEAPRTPFESAAKVVRSVQLKGVHFRAFSAQVFERAESIPEDATFAATTKFLRPIVSVNETGFLTRTTLLFRVGGKPDRESAPIPYADIRATLEATYGLKPDSPGFGDEELRDYALCYCPFHVWGYWREFVQSSLARLDLPQFTLPLFLIHQATEMVQDKLD